MTLQRIPLSKETRANIDALAKATGWTPPESPDHDQNYFRDDHGPVDVEDLPLFLVGEPLLLGAAELLRAAKKVLATLDYVIRRERAAEEQRALSDAIAKAEGR